MSIKTCKVYKKRDKAHFVLCKTPVTNQMDTDKNRKIEIRKTCELQIY